MPPQRRARVRTGCLTCRKRRRKCDEGKPVCQNCLDKRFDCRYGLNITFVGSKAHQTFEPKPTSAASHGPQSQVQARDGTAPARSDVPAIGSPHPQQQDEVESLSNNPASHISFEPELWARFAAPQSDIQPSRWREPSSQSARGSFTSAFDRLEPLSIPATPFIGLPNVLPSPSGTNTNLAQTLSRAGISSPQSSDHLDHQELELLTFYRYQIAPRLDLGVGEPYFGVRALLRAKSDAALRKSILSLSRYQKAHSDGSYLQDNGNSIRDHARNGTETIITADQEEEDRVTTLILVAHREYCESIPQLWSDRMRITLSNASVVFDGSLEGPWQLMARLALAAKLTGMPSSSSVDLSFVLQGASTTVPGQTMSHKQQLRQALSILARALLVSKPDTDARQTAGKLPLLSTWQSCWSDNQLWYSTRREELQQVFEVEEFESLLSPGIPKAPFPIILFSNVCAVLANFIHHLAALILLHCKPRAIKALAETGSSTSTVWHAQRLIGMIAAFDETDVFDPLVVAGVIYVAKRLSHPSQIVAVVDILNKAMQVTGMQLQEEIEKLKAAYTISAS